jgi:cystathionine beta-lyase
MARFEGGRPVNPPLVRAGTLLFESSAHLNEMRARRDNERVPTYGARGNATAFALEDVITELEDPAELIADLAQALEA